MVIPLWVGTNFWPPPGNSRLLSAGSRLFLLSTKQSISDYTLDQCLEPSQELDSSLEEEPMFQEQRLL